MLQLILNSRAKMSKFVMGISKMVVKEFHNTILNGDIDISCLMVHPQQIEEKKL